MPNDKACFVIAPIGEPDSETRKRSDQVLKHIIRPAVEMCGYTAVRADEIDKPGIITSQVIQRVVSDPLVVADLTDRNPNVFYELAIRHALRKPLVQVIKKSERIPFDVAGTRTIQVDHRDLDSVEAAKKEIAEQVKALEQDSTDMETPISVSLDLQFLRQSENPEDRSLADLVSAVSELRASVAKLEVKIGTQDEQGVLDEIKSALESLPRQLEDRFESSLGPFSSKRRHRLHPMMLREFMHMGPMGSSAGIEVLMIASFFRESMPWIYEIGVEAYRTMSRRPGPAAREALQEFRRIIDMSFHHPMARELFGRSKESMMLMDMIDPWLSEAVERLERHASA